MAGVRRIDGHDHLAINLKHWIREEFRQPSVIIMHTIPGRGVDFMEYDYRWHVENLQTPRKRSGRLLN